MATPSAAQTKFLSGLCDRERRCSRAGNAQPFLSGLCDREPTDSAEAAEQAFLSLCDRELDIALQGGKREGSAPASQPEAKQRPAQQQASGFEGMDDPSGFDMDDDIPF